MEFEGFAPLVASVRRLPAGETGATRKRKFKKKAPPSQRRDRNIWERKRRLV